MTRKDDMTDPADRELAQIAEIERFTKRVLQDLPTGTFDGKVLGRWSFLNRFWKGKTFTGSTVTNRIFGRQLVEGVVSREGDTVLIHYPQLLGLTDRLKSMSDDGSAWTGTMDLLIWRIAFTLTKQGDLHGVSRS